MRLVLWVSIKERGENKDLENIYSSPKIAGGKKLKPEFPYQTTQGFGGMTVLPFNMGSIKIKEKDWGCGSMGKAPNHKCETRVQIPRNQIKSKHRA